MNNIKINRSLNLHLSQTIKCKQQNQKKLNEFVKKSIVNKTKKCIICDDTKTFPCNLCEGKGILGKGGYQKKNHINERYIINSKWTAKEKTFGWRHFSVNQKYKIDKDTYLLMIATCDPNTKYWINMKNLRDRDNWSCGWLQKKDIDIETHNEIKSICKKCSGNGYIKCPYCIKK